MSTLTDRQDAFGHAIYDYLHGDAGAACVVERDDNLIEAGADMSLYSGDFPTWPRHQREAIRFARGRVLDIGCGAGRCLLYLQQNGHDVMGIDVSPHAVKLCRERGARQVRLMSITALSRRLGRFDTIIMYGNNFGLVENPRRAAWLLKKMHGLTSPAGRIIAESRNPYISPKPEHIEYHRRNRRRGRMPGQTRIKVRYKRYATPWFDWLLVSPDEMRDLMTGTGWHVARLFDSGCVRYMAVIEKD